MLEEIETEPREAFLHGALDAGQVFVDRTVGVTLVGLDHAGLGDPAWDLVQLTLWDPARLQMLLDAYGASGPLRAHLDRVDPAYRVIGHLAAARRAASRGGDPEPDLVMARRLSNTSRWGGSD